MPAIGNECRRAPRFAPPDQHERPCRVDGGGGGVDRKARARALQSRTNLKRFVCLGEDQNCRNDNHRTFENGGKKFGLVMPERVIGVSRLRADTHCDERGDGSHDVDYALKRIRIECDGAGDEIGSVLDRHNGCCDRDIDRGQARDLGLDDV